MLLNSGQYVDEYELLQPLGAGGMGEVWLARDPRLDRTVAIKFLPADLVQDADRLARFQREARAASVLNHPHVCTIFALGETPGGRPYLVLEYIDGETLRQRIAEHAYTVPESLSVAIAIASALVAAHARGIVHRDIKPENVMIRRDGLVKVLDFGLAKLAAPSDRFGAGTTVASAVTESGAVLGTVAYMAPEQARGEPVDHRADLWSLGVVLYELVARSVPFRGRSATDVLVGILEHDPPPLARFHADAPPELQRIIGKALKKDPDDRYQTARDLLLDLQALHDELRLQRSGASIHGQRVELRDRRRRATAAAALGVLVVALLAGAWWWSRQTGTSPPEAVARRLTRLTFTPGLQTDVTWSPDSRFIAYASDRSGSFDIWVQPVAGGDAVQVTRSEMPDTQPDWSPDGTRLAFRSERGGGGIYLVPVLGGAEQRLTTTGSQPRWSPDGRRLLFVEGHAVPGARGTRLRVASLDGSPEREVLPPFFVIQAADWHPDGRITALGFHQSQGPGLFTASADGGEPVACTISPEAARQIGAFSWFTVQGFRWDPDGRAIYLEIVDGNVQNLWKAAVDPGTMRITRAERLTTGTTRDSRAAVSRDGRRLAYTAQADSIRLWTLPIDAASGRITGGAEPLTDEAQQIRTSDASPDGRYAAFAVQRAGNLRRDLWVADLTTRTTRPLFQDDLERDYVRWAPDSRRLVYQRAPARVGNALVDMVAGGLDGREEVLASFDLSARPQPPFIAFDWTPDGRFLLGSSSPQGAPPDAIALWPVAPGGQAVTPKPLVQDARYAFWQSRFSPNGRFISFVYLPSGGQGYPAIAIAPAAGGGESTWRRVAPDQAWVDKPRWSPDGRLLYYLARDAQGRFHVWATRIDAATGAPEGRPFEVARMDRPDLLISPEMDRAEMSVTAKLIILTVRKLTGGIWLLEEETAAGRP